MRKTLTSIRRVWVGGAAGVQVGAVETMRTLAIILSICTGFSTASSVAWAQEIFPLSEVRAGQRGVGRTVFAGSQVEEFGVEILGVLQNIGPRQSVILARLDGGPLAETGVMQGMSGSPVYIDGRLVGAVALGFELSKEPIAGIRPIEEMLRVDPEADSGGAAAERGVRDVLVAGRNSTLGEGTRLIEIATPVSFSGFTESTLDHFAPQLRALGLDPRQGLSGGGNLGDELGDPASIEPGSMISVQLLSGDMSVGADGTVTMIDGGKVYAFGHQLLSGGPTELPFARAEVVALLPSVSSSFKISQAREWIGTITEDRSVAISGLTGRRAAMAPLRITVDGTAYNMRVIQDRVMTPVVAQMAVFSALDATQRTVGPATFHLRGTLDFEAGSIPIDDIYSGSNAVSTIAALNVTSPLNFALSSGFEALKLTGISLDIDVEQEIRSLRIASVIGPRTARPGDEVVLTVALAGQDGAQRTEQVRYHIPVGAPLGALNFTVADASSANSIELQGLTGAAFRDPVQVLELLRGLRSNAGAYLRVWRNEPNYTVEGRNLPAPPPSLRMILDRTQPEAANTANAWGSAMAEVPIAIDGDSMITGIETIRIEVVQ